METYRLGVNEFSDLTEEDFATHYLDAGYKARKAANGADRATREVWLGGIANPATLDWRTKGAVTQVKNQGQKKGKTKIKQKNNDAAALLYFLWLRRGLRSDSTNPLISKIPNTHFLSRPPLCKLTVHPKLDRVCIIFTFTQANVALAGASQRPARLKALTSWRRVLSGRCQSSN